MRTKRHGCFSSKAVTTWGDDPPAMGADPNAVPAGDYVERRKFCYCMSLKVGIILIGVLIIVNLVIEIINLIFISQNEYFDMVYPSIYGFILLPMVAAVALYIYYFSSRDSHSSRSNLPIALILATITSFLLVIWILVYIGAIYPKDKVYVNKWDKDTQLHVEDEDEHKHYRYTKQSKGTYIFSHILSPLVNGIAYLLFFFVTRDWVNRHQNQEKAHG